jgi:hypothetical protein
MTSKLGVAVVLLLGPLAGPALAQERVWLHVRADTRGVPGGQVSRFTAFATTDEAGSRPAVVAEICVRGIGHRVEERCAQDRSTIELEERAEGLPGVGSRCVRAEGRATWKGVPLRAATSEVCPR